jgi:hypothetical protein|tara:strand:- start:147 stop:374 length:228 start_codon:yes stop_codon:yes gene_type:complete
MKIIVETLIEKIDEFGISDFIVDESRTVNIKSKNITEAKNKADELKTSLNKIRILEFFNDEIGHLRKPCKIIYEI